MNESEQRAILIVRAAGRKGTQLVNHALARGSDVTAIIRGSYRLPRTDINVVVGDGAPLDITDGTLVDEMPAICTIAAPDRRRSAVMSDVTSNLIGSMLSLTRPARLVLTSSRCPASQRRSEL